MRGQLATWQKCPKCGGSFERKVIAATLTELICPKCLTRPTRYYLDIYDKKRHRVSHNKDGAFLADPETANALLAEIRNQIGFDPTQYVRKKQAAYLFKNVLVAWLTHCRIETAQGRLSPGTLAKKEGVARTYFTWFANEDIRHIKAHQITKFKQGLNLSGNYLNSILGQLSSIFLYAKEEELIEEIPYIKRVKVQDTTKMVLLPEEQDALIEQMPECHRPLFRFLKLTGCRPSMARALQRGDLNWKQRVIVFQHNYSARKLTRILKTGQILEFPMTDELYDLLRALPVNLNRYVFINALTGKPYTHHISEILYRACDKLALPHIPVKNFCRHSFATNLLAEGIPLQFVSQLLGHSSSKTTERSYATARIEVLRGVLEKKIKSDLSIHHKSS